MHIGEMSTATMLTVICHYLHLRRLEDIADNSTSLTLVMNQFQIGKGKCKTTSYYFPDKEREPQSSNCQFDNAKAGFSTTQANRGNTSLEA